RSRPSAGDAVLLSRDDYDALVETAYPLRVPPIPDGSSKVWPRPAPMSGKPTTWSDAARLHAPRLGGLPLLAGDRQGDPEAREPAAPRGPSRPFSGVGKPEPLRHVLAGCWSRRIDEEHRLVYLIDGDDEAAAST